MKDFTRQYPFFALCGLNCGLCPMHYIEGGGCPGCGGGEGNQSCPKAKCSLRHGGMEYCFECTEFPCDKYDGITEFDSFVPTRTIFTDCEKARRFGIDAYQAELDEKMSILQELLAGYNDGRRKSFFCTAVNLLELQDIREVMRQIISETSPDMPVSEKALLAVRHFQAKADQRGISLKLRKKPKEA